MNYISKLSKVKKKKILLTTMLYFNLFLWD